MIRIITLSFCLLSYLKASDFHPPILSSHDSFNYGMQYLLGEDLHVTNPTKAHQFFTDRLSIPMSESYLSYGNRIKTTNPLGAMRCYGAILSQETNFEVAAKLAKLLINQGGEKVRILGQIETLLLLNSDNDQARTYFKMGELFYRDFDGFYDFDLAKVYMQKALDTGHKTASLALSLIETDISRNKETPSFLFHYSADDKQFPQLRSYKAQWVFMTNKSLSFCLGIQYLIASFRDPTLTLSRQLPFNLNDIIDDLYGYLKGSESDSNTSRFNKIGKDTLSLNQADQLKILYELGVICQCQPYAPNSSYLDFALQIFEILIEEGYSDVADSLALAKFRKGLNVDNLDSTSQTQRAIMSWQSEN